MTTKQGHRPQHAGVDTNIHPFPCITFLLKSTVATIQQHYKNCKLKSTDRAEIEQFKAHCRDVKYAKVKCSEHNELKDQSYT